MSELTLLRARIEKLEAAGRRLEVCVMSYETWHALVEEYRAETGRGTALSMSGREVLGLPVEVHAIALGVAIVDEQGRVDTQVAL